MTASIDHARRIASELLRMESRGAGDLENAMKRLGVRHGINWRVFWALRYRAPKDMFVGVYEKLNTAYRAECGRQLERLQHELHVARAKGVVVDDIETTAGDLVAQLQKREH